MAKRRFGCEGPRYESERPRIAELSRRDFGKVLGGALIAGSAAMVVTTLSPKGKLTETTTKAERVTLPPQPSHNPAFQGWPLPDGAVVLTTYRQEEFLGYQLNRTGRFVWQLCNGSRSAEDIAEAYAEHTGRSAGEAAQFLQGLMDLAIVVSGGYVVPGGDLSRAAPGGCYYTQIKDHEGLRGSHES